MIKFFNSNIGRLRLMAFLEGMSFLVLLFVGVPLKHMYGNPAINEVLGPIHGAFFVIYVINTFSVASDANWSFSKTTLKVLAASIIPFGTFYVDHKILAPTHKEYLA
ncbi:MAG: integral membrane protein [Bacteroidia bacterium]|jgi:integral membrane protein